MTENNKWIDLTSEEELNQIDTESEEYPVVIFKHSTSCSISAMAWARFNRGLEKNLEKTAKYYYLDLLRHRDISNAVAEKYSVRHESPQILVILNGSCVKSASHMGISFSQLEEASKE